jgi:hypothetical protein
MSSGKNSEHRPERRSTSRKELFFSTQSGRRGRRRPFRGLNGSFDAFLARYKWARNKLASVVHSIPAGLDAPDLGFVFTDVMGNGVEFHHFRLSMRETLRCGRHAYAGKNFSAEQQAAMVPGVRSCERSKNFIRPGSRRVRELPAGVFYFCCSLLECAVFECSRAISDCCWALVECSLPLAWSFLP